MKHALKRTHTLLARETTQRDKGTHTHKVRTGRQLSLLLHNALLSPTLSLRHRSRPRAAPGPAPAPGRPPAHALAAACDAPAAVPAAAVPGRRHTRRDRESGESANWPAHATERALELALATYWPGVARKQAQATEACAGAPLIVSWRRTAGQG